MVADHNIGGSVQREFTDIQDYEEWYEAVQDAFSVEFMKKMGIKQHVDFRVIILLIGSSSVADYLSLLCSRRSPKASKIASL